MSIGKPTYSEAIARARLSTAGSLTVLLIRKVGWKEQNMSASEMRQQVHVREVPFCFERLDVRRALYMYAFLWN